jgi:hypothetical protein
LFRYFVRRAKCEYGEGHVYYEFEGQWVSRQVEIYQSKCFRYEGRLEVCSQPFDAMGFAKDDEITSDEFGRIWDTALKDCQPGPYTLRRKRAADVTNEPKRMVEVPLDEVMGLFAVLDKLNHFFHEPYNYEIGKVSKFMGTIREPGAYADIHYLYYDVVRNWLPPDIQEEIENR